MDIVCPKCSTEYEFDEDRVTDAGVAVKCTTCDHTFKVRRPAEPSAPHEPAKGTSSWMIRTVSGALLEFDELPTLQQWIIERKVTREDQISRSGETWKPLGDISELASFFQVMDAANSGTGEHLVQEDEPPTKRKGSGGTPSAAQGAGAPSDFGASGAEPAFAASASQLAAVGSTAAWEDASSHLGSSGDNLEDSADGRSSSSKMLLIVLILGVGLAATAGIVFKGEAIGSFFSTLFSKETLSGAYQIGREAFLQDDLESLKRADRELAKAPKTSAIAKAARAEVFTTWSQHLQDQAELMEREASSLELGAAKVRHAPPKPATPKRRRPRRLSKKEQQEADQRALKADQMINRAKSLRLEASKLRQDAKAKIQVAEAHAQAAVAEKADRAEVYRAIADLHRLQGKTDIATLLTKVRNTAPEDPEAYYVEGLYALTHKDLSRANTLLHTAIIKTKAYSKHILLRAAFQLAMIHLRAGRHTEARQYVDSILVANSKHQLARQLLTRIADEQASAKGLNSAASGGIAAKATSVSATSAAGKPGAKSGSTLTRVTPASGTPDPSRKAAGGKPKRWAAAPKTYAGLVKAADRAAEYGRSGKALGYYEAALKLNSRGVEAYVGIGYCELDVQRFSSALARFRKALAISSRSGEAMMGMATAYKALGNLQKALDYYKAFVRVHPNAAKAQQARRHIKDLEGRLGKSGGASSGSPAATPPAATPPAATPPAATPPSKLEPTPGAAAPAPETTLPAAAKEPTPKPAAKEPAAKPTAAKPAAKEPAAKPNAAKPAAKEPAAKPNAAKPAAKEPAAKPTASI